MSKLKLLGVPGNIIRLMETFLTSRPQQILTNDKNSQILNNIRGIPQGSILAPLIYNIFVLDLPMNFRHNHVIQYADDTQVICAIEQKSISHIVDDLQRFETWCRDNELLINTKKSKTMVFFSNMKIDIILSDTHLEQVSEYKNLGVIFDKHLTFKRQIDRVMSIGSAKLTQLSRITRLLPFKLRRTTLGTMGLYPSLYGSPVFYPFMLQGDISKLQKLQNWSVRLLFNKPRFHPTSRLLRESEWLALDQLLLVNYCVHAYQSYRGRSVLSTYIRRTHRSNRSTARNVFTLPPIGHCSDKSLKYLGPSLLNKYLPLIREITQEEWPD